MEGQRGIVVLCWLLLVITIVQSRAQKADSDDSDKHEIFPRTFGFFSRPRNDNTESQSAASGFGNFGNVFGGGSFGFHLEARPLAPLATFIDHAKKFIPNPFAPSNSGKDKKDDQHDLPDKEKPSSETSWKEENPSEENPEPWEIVHPPVPRPGRPRPNVDEKPQETSEYTTEPIENIIQPRIRPRQKRSIESRIIHVPLEFLSNAKPYQVKIKRDWRHKY